MYFTITRSSLTIVLIAVHPIVSAFIEKTTYATPEYRPGLNCPKGHYIYKIPPGIYTNDDGVDQSVDPGYMCRRCQICPDGAKVTEPCHVTGDTVCGECIEHDHVFDQATKSCQPRYIVEGRSKVDSTPVNSYTVVGDIDFKTAASEVSAADIDTLFIAAATLFSCVVFTAVLLLICGVVVFIHRKQKEKKGNTNENCEQANNRKGRNLPMKIPAFADPKDKPVKSGHINKNFTADGQENGGKGLLESDTVCLLQNISENSNCC